ncbi:hypothetical protein NDU88_002916 [Pleurodeles waltl]|uniref:Uncharacterized protein n=1 Tax=Pleurodeles waltl TaxID=8319 RepID=A0AAV7KTG1_PLEWA|nr:hypothetical protein NDU88_002916 [Pleurodeles waltl]
MEPLGCHYELTVKRFLSCIPNSQGSVTVPSPALEKAGIALTYFIVGPDSGPTLRERQTARQLGRRTRSVMKSTWTRKCIRGHGNITLERVPIPGARARSKVAKIKEGL